MMNIETVLPSYKLSANTAVILRNLCFLEKLRYIPDDLAMNVTVQPPDFEKILIHCRLPPTHTRQSISRKCWAWRNG
ncbi:hypothetical protein CDAR_197031 [Caerostris darwini]|uniref:Uncharacterized protein n=1 Tax=Caerostris darwini TaxID=1538125 RepID=A0AAV4SM67_9ARAC|nr:hypothetical protein CDAR_197031 [Caerostris darwini]